MGLAPTGVWRVPPPIPHCNWRTLHSSQTPSLPALSFPLPPPPLALFARLREGAVQAGEGDGVLGRKSKHQFGPDPHLGVLQTPTPPPPDKPPPPSHLRGLDFGPFRLCLAPFGSVWLRLAPFRVCSGSVSGPLGGVVVGSVRGASVREKYHYHSRHPKRLAGVRGGGGKTGSSCHFLRFPLFCSPCWSPEAGKKQHDKYPLTAVIVL